jgi:hypothetical protein
VAACCPTGNVFVFLGDSVDYNRILFYHDGLFEAVVNSIFNAATVGAFAFAFPTTSPSGSYAPSSMPSLTGMPSGVLQTITLLINFDTYSSIAVSWLVSTPDGKVVKQAPKGTYGPFDGDVVTETIVLELGRDYIFTIRDDGGDGICCNAGEGYVEIYFGTDLSVDEVLLYDLGDFVYGRSQYFKVSSDATFVVTQPPSAAPSISQAPSLSIFPSSAPVDVIVEIQFDR